MDTLLIILLAVAAVTVVTVIGFVYVYNAQQRRERLRRQFGPEYERAVDRYGDEGAAERELEQRRRRVERYRLKELPPTQAQEFAERWRSAQARFVDDPPGAVKDAEELCTEVMNARGYPVADFERQAEDVSVEHPQVASDYRAAHEIALRNERGEATTEDLRQAMVYYRSLFDELLGKGVSVESRTAPGRQS
jgi:hypothetical protein